MSISPEVAIGIAVFLGLVFSIVVHECAHGLMAYWRGDDTAYLLGRITLDPIPHIDPFMSVLLPAIMLMASGGTMAFGGAKPVPVDPTRLRRPLQDMMWVAGAGPLSNVVLAAGFALAINALVWLPDGPMILNAYKILSSLVMINLLLAVFNMIPIPPLDGSRILAGLLPAQQRMALMSLEQVGIPLIMVLIFLGPSVGLHILTPAVSLANWMMQLLVFTT